MELPWLPDCYSKIFFISPKFHKKTSSRAGDIKHFCPGGGGGCILPPTSPINGRMEGLIEKQSLFSYTVFDLMTWVIIFQMRVFCVEIFWGEMH